MYPRRVAFFFKTVVAEMHVIFCFVRYEGGQNKPADPILSLYGSPFDTAMLEHESGSLGGGEVGTAEL